MRVFTHQPSDTPIAKYLILFVRLLVLAPVCKGEGPYYLDDEFYDVEFNRGGLYTNG